MTKRLLAASLALFMSPAIATELVKEIPAKYVGTWSSDKKYCKDDHLYNLAITTHNLTFFESSGPAIAIVSQANQLALILKLTGEGDEWIHFSHFELSDNGKELKDISDPYSKEQLIRFKCE